MIDYDQVLFADRFSLESRKKFGRKWNLLKALNDLFFTCFKFPREKEARFVFFRWMVREDYKQLMHNIASVIGNQEKIFIEDYLRESVKVAPRGIVVLFQLLPKFFSFRASDLYERIYLYLRLCFYYRHLFALSKYKFEIIVFFADMQPVENLLAQYFRNKGIKTVTLQHGLYVNYRDYPTVNVINYLHQPSEYFLAWGESTADLIRISGNGRKVVICGKPTIALKALNDCESNLSSENYQPYFTVILDQNMCHAQNIDMLHLLSHFAECVSLEMNVRYHPGNNRAVYESLGLKYYTNLNIQNSTFVVGHTSSMMYEIMLLGIPVFKFASDIPCVAMPDELIFDSLSRLQEVVNSASKMDFEKLCTEYIAFFGDESLKKYGDFFNALKNNRTVELESEK